MQTASFVARLARTLTDKYKEYLFFDSSGKSYTLVRKRQVVSHLGESKPNVGDMVEICACCGSASWKVKVVKVSTLYGFITLESDVDIRSHEPDLYIPTQGQTFFQGAISGGVPSFQRGRISYMDLMNMPYLGSIKDNVSGAEGCGLFSERGFALIGICVSVTEESCGGNILRFIPTEFCA